MKLLDSQWLKRLHASVNQPPSLPRDPLVFGDAVIGSVVSDAFCAVVEDNDLFSSDELVRVQTQQGPSWRISGNATTVLQKVADALRGARYARVAEQWRDEPLAVLDATGQQIAVVERGAARALGIATRCVHLTGYTPDQKVWIQQRAWNKENDPGRWDTLMGGMVSALDSIATALARETLEEAGLGVDQLHDLQWAGHFTMNMPGSDDAGLGYVIEHIDWFECIVPDGLVPLNNDGEVQQFKLVQQAQLHSMLQDHAFTAEAALILAQSKYRQSNH
jgi:8-oxo-dGTP pyrophosphatase MutT (NUDIX family)